MTPTPGTIERCERLLPGVRLVAIPQNHTKAIRRALATLPEATARPDDPPPLVVFLRHPLHRLVSAFLEHVVERDDRGAQAALRREIADTYGIDPTAVAQRGVSFRDVVLHVARVPDDQLDPRWRPQAWFLRNIQPDLVLDADALDEAIQRVARRLGLPSAPRQQPPPPEPAPWRGPTMCDITSDELRHHALRPHARALFTPGLAEIALDRYREDLDLLRAAGLLDAASPDAGILGAMPERRRAA